MTRPTTTLKTILNRRQATILAGAANGLFARVIEDLGYEAVYITGAGVANMYLGAPDIGLTTLTEIAGRMGKSVAQVVLRWHIQHGNVVFPKSVTPERIRENIQIFDFELEPADVATIDGLDRGEAGRNGPNPDTFAYLPG